MKERDRRKDKRVPVELDVDFLASIGEELVEGKGKTINASKRGYMIRADNEIPVDSVIYLDLETDTREVEVMGRVVHCGYDEKTGNYRIGLKISRIKASPKEEEEEKI